MPAYYIIMDRMNRNGVGYLDDNSVCRNSLFDIIKLQTEVAQQGMDIGNIMDLVVRRTQIMTHAEGACIELIEKDQLVYSAASGITEKFLGLRLNIENSLSGECIKMKMPLICKDIETDDRVNKEACRKIGINSMIVIPFINEGDVVGVLKVLSTKIDHFNKEHISILGLVSGLIAAEMFNAVKNGESELIYKATHDSLTGISNRALFYDRLRQKLSRALRNHEEFAILSLDMDGLKHINDTYGHRVGDAALKEVASRIKQTISPVDTVSRLGGDEFGVILTRVVKRQHILTCIHQIDSEITKPFEFENIKLELRVSIGYAHFREDGIELEHLIEKADQSMYEEKKKKKKLFQNESDKDRN